MDAAQLPSFSVSYKCHWVQVFVSFVNRLSGVFWKHLKPFEWIAFNCNITIYKRIFDWIFDFNVFVFYVAEYFFFSLLLLFLFYNVMECETSLSGEAGWQKETSRNVNKLCACVCVFYKVSVYVLLNDVQFVGVNYGNGRITPSHMASGQTSIVHNQRYIFANRFRSYTWQRCCEKADAGYSGKFWWKQNRCSIRRQ